MSHYDRCLEIMGLSDVPIDTSFISSAITILGFGIHILDKNLGTIEIMPLEEGCVDIMFLQRADGYHYGDPDPINVGFNKGAFRLVLKGRGFYRVRDLNKRIDAATKIKKLTIIATEEAAERHDSAIKGMPELHEQMWL